VPYLNYRTFEKGPKKKINSFSKNFVNKVSANVVKKYFGLLFVAKFFTF
jgi:hypothetical protein